MAERRFPEAAKEDADGGPMTNQSRVEVTGRITDKVIAQASKEADILLVNIEEGEFKLKELVAQLDRWKQEREGWLSVIAKLNGNLP